MFSRFFKNSKQKPQQISASRTDACSKLLRFQIELTDQDCSSARMRTPFAMGYIFGHADAMFVKEGVSDDQERLRDIAAVFASMFGPDEGRQAFDECLAIQDEPNFVRARTVGGEEIDALINAMKSGGRMTPTGLRDYLQSGKG